MACRRSDVSTPPPSFHQPKVDLLNDRLRSELGEVSGRPKFKWMWSEEAVHPFRVMSLSDTPTPIYDYRCLCGVNVADGKHHLVVTVTDYTTEDGSEVKAESLCPESVTAEPCYEMRRLCTLWKNTDGTPIRDQWMLWGWVPPPDLTSWKQTFGDMLDYGEYASGTFEPVTVAGCVAVLRKRRQLPTMDLTVEFCRLLDVSRTISYQEKLSRWYDTMAAEKKQKHTNAVDMLKDKMGNLNFGTKASLLPGRQGSISFGGLTPILEARTTRAERSRKNGEIESTKLIVKDRRSIVGIDK